MKHTPQSTYEVLYMRHKITKTHNTQKHKTKHTKHETWDTDHIYAAQKHKNTQNTKHKTYATKHLRSIIYATQ